MYNYHLIIFVVQFRKKLFEVVRKNIILMYCEKFNVLGSIQIGFKRGISKVTPIHDFVCNVLMSIECKENVFRIFFDLSKIFYMVNHKIFLENLVFYGILELANTVIGLSHI